MARAKSDPLGGFHEPTRAWFAASFEKPTRVQMGAFPALAAGDSTLLLAPTGSGKTLAAFLAALDRLAFGPPPESPRARCRVLYVSPLKALGVDVERNLRAPLAGLARDAGRLGVPMNEITVEVRSGDTAAKDRARMAKRPPDVLVTTPESLYLMLTSGAQAALAGVDTVIVDEIHSMLPTKRGAHLFLSLERLAALVSPRPLVRIGLSATVRPVDEAARLLGGLGDDGRPRPVQIVDARADRPLVVSVEVPVPDMSRLGEEEDMPSGPVAGPLPRRSIWPSLYPRIVEHVRAHRSTMIFVNSRRLAERLATAINDEAGEPLAAAHHGSLAREQRVVIEDRLKRGELPAIVATSSLELGIDMGSVDLVLQIEAPPSVSAGLQRIGRASHQVGGTPRGVLFPKHRGDLLACATAAERILAGDVEATSYPRLPLDVLAQQVVAIVAATDRPVPVSELFLMVRRSAPFAELPRPVLDGVLDMLSGRYPSDDFAGLRPRLTWDRVGDTLTARAGALRLAVVNGGTIPDRGLFGVFMAGADEGSSKRVGELDEEMVFESRVGDVFLLGSSTWRVQEITHDRVIVTPAPGEAGRMPFWRGDGPGRSRAFGLAIGALARTIKGLPGDEAEARLRDKNKLDELAAKNLVAYVADQVEATGDVPSDRTVIVERFRDELGDLRVAILTPLGSRVHAPWAAVLLTALREGRGLEAEAIWNDDGIVLRLPELDDPPDDATLFPSADEIESLVTIAVGGTALFAAKFREAAGRALLLPRRHPGQRTALWKQRKRSADLLAVASRYRSFPLVLEAYRECLKDAWDLPGLVQLLADVAARKVRVVTADTKRPSPFASSLMFGFVGAFLYDGDLPLAERRAQALRVDPAELARVLGEPALRDLLDEEAIAEVTAMLQRTDGRFPLRHADDVHDLLLSIGDLTAAEIGARAAGPIDAALADLAKAGRVLTLRIGGDERLVAVEDAARYRDALGVPLPRGVPDALLGATDDPLASLLARYARTHGPFLPAQIAARFGLGVGAASHVLGSLVEAGRVIAGELIPKCTERAFVDAEVLRLLRRRSLARLRAEIEPVDAAAVGRFLPAWHGIDRPRRGREGLLAVVAQLEGAPLVASTLESEILSARIAGYATGDLDVLLASGEVVWAGVEPLGSSDGKIALFLADHEALLARAPAVVEGEIAVRTLSLLDAHGALFFSDLVRRLGGYPGEIASTLWDLVWAGEVSNDTLMPLRAFLRGALDSSPSRNARVVPGLEGRWWRRSASRPSLPSPAERMATLARTLLDRHGVVTREVVLAEGVPGGFAAVYPALREMEARGQARRGYFVAGAGALQFAVPGADDRLRAHRDDGAGETRILAATDPANPYGSSLSWPEVEGARFARAAGARVVLHDGLLVGFVGRGGDSLVTVLPDVEPARSRAAAGLARCMADAVDRAPSQGMLVVSIDGSPPRESPLAPVFVEAGFTLGAQGLARRRRPLDPGRPALDARR